MTIRRNYANEGKNLLVMPVVITQMVLGSNEKDVPCAFVLEMKNQQGAQTRVGINFGQMNDLKKSIEEILAKFPNLAQE